jgi:hypothetical protein
MVRVDFFKPSGKWYATEEMNWQGFTGEIYDLYKQNLWRTFSERYKDTTAVCLEPYHEHAHPLALTNWW